MKLNARPQEAVHSLALNNILTVIKRFNTKLQKTLITLNVINGN